MTILLTGGAGYIGSITTQYLRKKGYQIIVFDNFSTGHKDAIGDTPYITGDIRNREDIELAFQNYKIDSVIHFAAKALAGESMEKPHEYYETNVLGMINLLETMKHHNTQTIVFSSSCSVYGHPDTLPVTEDMPYKPLSVYGETKMMGEMILKRYSDLFNFRTAILRYFNACGAALDGSLGERHTPETHLIPNIIHTALTNSTVELYGTDYNTKDGTCIRDYIHVLDLADAHEKALNYIQQNSSVICNIGTGNGYSNKDIIQTVETVANCSLTVSEKPRRAGDPDAIFADSTRAQELLQWTPKYSDLKTIIESALLWHKYHNPEYKNI